MEKTSKQGFVHLDGFVKFILAVVIITIAFCIENMASIGILAIYLLLVTLVLKISYKTLAVSAASYILIVLIPYFFGLLINTLVYSVTHNELFLMTQEPYAIFLRLFRLFVLWFCSILYFHTTPMETVLALLNKLLIPLKWLKIPVEDFLKILMCVMGELKGTGEEIKTAFMDSARAVLKGNNDGWRLRIKGLSQIIVSLLINSFQKLDRVESLVENIAEDELLDYRINLTKADLIASLNVVLLIAVLLVTEGVYVLII